MSQHINQVTAAGLVRSHSGPTRSHSPRLFFAELWAWWSIHWHGDPYTGLLIHIWWSTPWGCIHCPGDPHIEIVIHRLAGWSFRFEQPRHHWEHPRHHMWTSPRLFVNRLLVRELNIICELYQKLFLNELKIIFELYKSYYWTNSTLFVNMIKINFEQTQNHLWTF